MSDPVIKSLADWIDEALSDLTAVIYRSQSAADAPRPVSPYATVKLMTSESAGEPYRMTSTTLVDEEDPDSYFVETKEEPFVGLLRVDLYGAGSMARARLLRRSLSDDAVKAIFAAAVDAQSNDLRLVVREFRTIQDATGLRDTKNEESAYLDILVAWIETTTIERDVIETVVFEGQGDIDDIEFEVP